MRYLREDSNRVMTIGYVSPAWPPGTAANGVATYTAHMVHALRALGQRPYVFARKIGEGPQEDFVVDVGPSRTERSWWKRAGNYLEYRLAPERRTTHIMAVSLRRRILALAEEVPLDIVEMEEAFGLARRVAAGSSVPIVVRLHGPWFLNACARGIPQDSAFWRRVRSEGSAIRSASAVSAPSQDVLDRTRSFYGLDLPQAEVIPNAMAECDPHLRWTPTMCGLHQILFVGRFDLHKGMDLAIVAFAKIAKVMPEARLVLVGPDLGLIRAHGRRIGLEQYLQETLPETDVRTRVKWLGRLSAGDIAKLRRKSSVTLVCSRYEVFGLTATEAMVAGCPLVVSNVGGLREIVQNGRNGLLCSPGDPDDLARKTVTLLRNPDLAARLGQQAARDVRNRYDPTRIANQTLDVYRRVIERSRRQPRRPAEGGSHA